MSKKEEHIQIQYTHTACVQMYFDFFKNLYTLTFTKVATQHDDTQQCIIVREF